MNIESAKYIISEYTELKTIKARIDSKELIVPLEPANRHYKAIQEWVAEGNTIQEAE